MFIDILIQSPIKLHIVNHDCQLFGDLFAEDYVIRDDRIGF